MGESGTEYQVLGFFYHRPYMCVSFMEEAAAHTPGISPDTLHEEFIGPPDTRTPPVHLSDLRPDRWPTIVRVVLTIIRKTKSLSSDTEECEENINRQREESTPEALKDWTDDLLIEGVSFSKAMAWVSDVHIWASTFAVLYFDLLRKQTKAWLNDEKGSLAAQMVTGIGTLPSANPAFGLYDLAKMVMSSPEISNLFTSNSDNESLLDLINTDANKKDFKTSLEEFLTLHGHRAVCEAEFRSPTWREDPTQIIGLIRNYLQPGVTPPEELRIRQERTRDEAMKQVDRLPQPKRFIMKRVLKAARRNIEFREGLKDLIVLRSDRFRRIYAEIRTRLLDRGWLYDPDDLFFLMWKEVRDLLNGKLSPEVAKEIISRRRQDFEWCQMVHVPKIINGKAIVVKPDEFPSEQQLQGMGVSPGKVEGRARVILDPRVESHIEPGEILIAPVTDAGWTPLFITAGGLIVDIGGLLSHGSIVAREYGLPAVVGVADATRRIKTGERIYLDGSTGLVIKLD
jgi:pyruvate,water dikinase